MHTLFDSHCHFDHAAFDTQRAAILHQGAEQGLANLFVPGLQPAQWPTLAQLQKLWPQCHYGLGLHPWYIDSYFKQSANSAADFENILQQAFSQHTAVAVGECGLDSLIDCPMVLQQEVLAIHIRVANQQQLPIILHNVKSHNLLLQQLSLTPCVNGGIIHAFSGSYEQALAYCQRGFYIGVGGTITYARAKKTRAAIAQLPLEHLVLETDAPDMPLQGFQGQPNSPLQLSLVAHALAALKNCSYSDVLQHTGHNSMKLFGVSSDRVNA